MVETGAGLYLDKALIPSALDRAASIAPRQHCAHPAPRQKHDTSDTHFFLTVLLKVLFK
jgi:hypothetical protein